MEKLIFRANAPVTLVGGSGLDGDTLRRALAIAPVLVAADGGADRAIAAGHLPEAVIGDMDSLSASARAALGPDRLHPVSEQDSTDFDKCLRAIRAPFVIAVGFDGDRMDHTLAAFNTLARQPGPACILLGPHDAVFLAPARAFDLALAVGTRLSLFPMGAVTGQGHGLRWPIEGIGFASDGRIGTSNEVAQTPVHLQFSTGRMLVIVPATALAAVVSALLPG